MTRTKYLAGLALGILMAGCNSEEASEQTSGMNTLKTTVESYATSTRAGFQDNSGEFFWTAGDVIGTTTSTANNAFAGMTLTNGAGTSTATFTGSMSGTPAGYAVYPYVEMGYQQITAEGQLTYQFPDSYTYTTLDGEYGKTGGNSFNPPMWAAVADGKALFKHLGGIFAIGINKLPQGSNMQFIFKTPGRKITGTFSANLTATEPLLVTSEAETENTVTINFSTGASDATGFFYIPVPTGTYPSILVVVKDGSGKEIATGTWSNQTVGRRVIKRGTIGEQSLTGGEASTTTVEDVSKVGEALTNNDNVTVEGEVSGTNNEITLPAPTMDNKPKTLVFQNIATEASLTVKEPTQTSGTGGQLTLSIPETPAGNTAPTVTVDTPNQTVTLSSNSGTATYGTVNASTADNTLIISAGVTVTTLNVVKGNVQVKKGGKIETVSKDGNNASSTVYILLEDGAEAPSTVNTGCTAISTAEYELKAACEKGGSYSLPSNVVLSAPLAVKNAMTLDLNGHSIKPGKANWGKVQNTQDAVILVCRGGNLTINDSSNGQGSIDYDGFATICTALKLTDSQDQATGNAELTVNGGSIKGNDYGISGNGTRNGTKITINGGNITATDKDAVGIYHPQLGELKVTNGNIIGITGIEMRSGTLTVTGGTIKSTATQFGKEGNGNGATIKGVAVAISQHVTNQALSVNINGGILSGPYAFYEEDLQDEVVNDISMKVTAGTLNGNVYTENCAKTAFVTGGTFTDPTALQYLGANANVKVNMKEDKTCGGFKAQSGQTVVIDLGGKALTLGTPTVGSTGTETNSCQLQKGSTVTFKNGTLTSPNEKIIIQNYCNLTLENLTATGTQAQYVVSNNCGNIVINNTTINAGNGANQFAFDVCGFSNYTEGVTVTVRGTSVINGKVEISKSPGNIEMMKLNIEGGEFKGDLKIDSSVTAEAAKEIISISGTPTFTGNTWDAYNKNAE